MAWKLFFGRERKNSHDIKWDVYPDSKDFGLPDGEGLMIALCPPELVLSHRIVLDRFAAVESVKQAIERTIRPEPINWIMPGVREWTLDLDGLRQSHEGLKGFAWLQGTFSAEPEYERRPFRFHDETYPSGLTFYLTPEIVGKPSAMECAYYGDRWERLRYLGAGGQGEVWVVRDISRCESHEHQRTKILSAIRGVVNEPSMAKKDVSANDLLKTLRELLEANDPSQLGALKELRNPDEARDPDPAKTKERMRREIEAMADISHPNLLRILDHDSHGSYFVSEYHPNGTLETRQHDFAGHVAASLTALRPIVAGVAELHKNNFVHRDIKPHNIFYSADNRPILGDFGLVISTDETHRLTASLDNAGSWEWMPEWATGFRAEQINPTFDVFSLGKLLWWMLSDLPIEKLRLWKIDKPDLDVEKLWPDKRHIQVAKQILRKCVVEDESDCLPHADALLAEIDTSLTIIENNGDLIWNTKALPCRICGIGSYRATTNPHLRQGLGIENLAGRSFDFYVCEHCGNLQLFTFEADSHSKELRPPAWSR